MRFNRYPSFGPLRPGDDSIDTLDELLFQLASRPGGITSNQPDVFMELLGSPAPVQADAAELPSGVVWQYLRGFLHEAGRGLVEIEPGEHLAAALVESCYPS